MLISLFISHSRSQIEGNETRISKFIDMNELVIKKWNTPENASWEIITSSLELSSWNDIDVVNWPEYNYHPLVQFRMMYSDTEILLQYRVKEKYIRAVATHDHGEVWKDSCVEFFVAPANDGIYYNFEFNCCGVCLLAAGTSRHGREKAPLEVVTQTRRLPSLGRNIFQERTINTDWNIVLAIPYSCFFKHPEYSPTGKNVRANFYKCGDDLTEPHYLSWNPIGTEKPDFHRPEYFGLLHFR